MELTFFLLLLKKVKGVRDYHHISPKTPAPQSKPVPRGSICFYLNSTDPTQLIHWSLKNQGVEPPNLLGLSCRLRLDCGMTFPTVGDGMLDGLKGVVNRWLLP